MSKTVLVADESVTIRSVAESLLRGEAYSVRSAADGNMAMELAKTEKPDLVLIGEQLYGYSDGYGWVSQEFRNGEIVWNHSDRAVMHVREFSPEFLVGIWQSSPTKLLIVSAATNLKLRAYSFLTG